MSYNHIYADHNLSMTMIITITHIYEIYINPSIYIHKHMRVESLEVFCNIIFKACLTSLYKLDTKICVLNGNFSSNESFPSLYKHKPYQFDQNDSLETKDNPIQI